MKPGQRKHRRVRWRVRQCPTGWLPIVLVGEQPFTMRAQPSKHAARAMARAKAKEFTGMKTSIGEEGEAK
jgi:hypothetical protein